MRRLYSFLRTNLAEDTDLVTLGLTMAGSHEQLDGIAVLSAKNCNATCVGKETHSVLIACELAIRLMVVLNPLCYLLACTAQDHRFMSLVTGSPLLQIALAHLARATTLRFFRFLTETQTDDITAALLARKLDQLNAALSAP